MGDEPMINGGRLWDSIMEIAKIGPTDKGGSCRLALTDLDREARDLFVEWCRDAGCTISVDKMGNIFARRPGTDPNLPPVVAGSHLDTQPTGGRFDGVYGVLTGLEVIRSLNDHGIQTRHPVEAACWTNEEGSRFAPAMVASGVFAGIYDLEYGLSRADEEGKTMGEELERIGYAGTETPESHEVGSYFELHIEQGPILESENRTIGVVTAAQGQRWYEITVTGQESHAGPTPMPVRRDALFAASKIVQEVNRVGHHHQPHACATVGQMLVSPNSRNVIPGSVFLTVDFRHPVDETLSNMDQTLKAFCATLANENEVRIDIVDFWYFPPTPFEDGCIEAVREGAKAAGFEHMDIISGAGHDAVYIAGVAPTGMIFVPCEDGISHNETENATPEDCAAGCQVLLHAILARAETLD